MNAAEGHGLELELYEHKVRTASAYTSRSHTAHIPFAKVGRHMYFWHPHSCPFPPHSLSLSLSLFLPTGFNECDTMAT